MIFDLLLVGIVCTIRYKFFFQFSVWLRTSSNPADMNRFWSHNGKSLLSIAILIQLEGSAAARQPPVSLNEIKILQFKNLAASQNLTKIWQSPSFQKKNSKHPNRFKFEALSRRPRGCRASLNKETIYKSKNSKFSEKYLFDKYENLVINLLV